MLTKIGKWLRPRRRSVMRGTLQTGGLGCLAGSAFTIAATPINITLGLAVTGVLAFVAEWLADDA
ncbi:hypothetical protein [Amycolatopsis stemonae]